jgi:hypothetical protein
LSSRWRQKVLAVGSREYVWLDVFLAAMLRGEWREFERRLLEGLACAAAEGADRRTIWPDDRQIEEAANAFRYERGLIASDETIAWLDRAGLTFDAWTNYLVRRLLHARCRDQLDDIPQPHATTEKVADVDFAAEGMCSGTFDRFLKTLAGRAAIAALRDQADHPAVDHPVVDHPAVDPSRIDRMLAEHAAWLGALDADDITERAVHLAQLESAYHALVGAVTTADALASQLARYRFEWTRVDLERLSFESADAAREAACCVREDGLTLSEVAIESRQPMRDTRDLLERLDPGLRNAVLGAGVDELAGPVVVGSRHEVVWVVGKRPADLADPIVRARAESAVVDQMVARAILTQVRWAGGPRGARHSPPESGRPGASTE